MTVARETEKENEIGRHTETDTGKEAEFGLSTYTLYKSVSYATAWPTNGYYPWLRLKHGLL